MRIAVASSNGGGLEDTISAVFARAPAFTIVDVENGEIKNVKIIQNQAMSAPRGAGIMAVQMLINEGIDTVIAGQYGPNAYDALQASGIRIYTFPAGTSIKKAIEKIIKGEIPQEQVSTATPYVPPMYFPDYSQQTTVPMPPYPTYGFGAGMRGFGRGRRRGRGRRWWF
jgi:predicted Fe-Mo cluster-binding NifX family protein